MPRFVWSEQLNAIRMGFETRPRQKCRQAWASRLTDAAVALRQPRLEYDSPRSDEHSILAVSPPIRTGS